MKKQPLCVLTCSTCGLPLPRPGGGLVDPCIRCGTTAGTLNVESVGVEIVAARATCINRLRIPGDLREVRLEHRLRAAATAGACVEIVDDDGELAVVPSFALHRALGHLRRDLHDLNGGTL